MVVKHYMPSSESKLDEWIANYVKTLSASPDVYGMTAEDIQTLETNSTAWHTAFENVLTARDQAKAAVVTKDMEKEAVEAIVRSTARRIQADDRIPADARALAGLPVHKTHRTPVGVPTTYPVGQVIGTDRQEHTIMFSDSATPTKRAKPTGVSACEIYVYVGQNAPTDEKSFRFVGLATRSTYRVKFEAEDGGKIAHYLLRWVNTKDAPGPWSHGLSATIPAV